MEASIFLEISLILVIATAVAGVTALFRQPLIIGHIVTGILVGPSVFNLVKSTETAQLFSHIGVALLLFIIGLGLNPRVIREVGKVSLLTGMGQIVFTSALGFWLARLLGFSSTVALYIAVALTFSSTIIILKLLSDKKELNRLYGKIATGFLLVQDIVAVLILIFISSFADQTVGAGLVLQTVLKGGLFAVALSLLAIYVLPRLSEFFAHSQEFLFLFAIGWGLGVAALCAALGFSIEIGALAAGVALASSPYSYEISSRMRSLRDFFIILFFIVLGTGLSLSNLAPVLLPGLVFSLFVLIGNPLIVMAIMGWLGYTKKTSFKAGLATAQISEFSLILIVLGSQVGQLSQEIVALMTLVGMITIAGSTYLILYDDQLFEILAPYLKVFERKAVKKETGGDDIYEVVLFGYRAGGADFIQTFKALGKRFLVVDYDPETIDQLNAQKVPCRYGDADDYEFLEELHLDKAKLVVINLTDFPTNRLITTQVRQRNQRSIVLAMTKTDQVEEALELYDQGATYVIMPRYLGSYKIGRLLKRYSLDRQRFRVERERHKRYLMRQAV
ncbi:cation:proton antiporter [Candidatus Microgenomates bacterium]|nr:cation:proton antiporter [Candidatus Microgenomates bacterium]